MVDEEKMEIVPIMAGEMTLPEHTPEWVLKFCMALNEADYGVSAVGTKDGAYRIVVMLEDEAPIGVELTQSEAMQGLGEAN